MKGTESLYQLIIKGEKRKNIPLFSHEKEKVTLLMVRLQWVNIWTAVGKFDLHNAQLYDCVSFIKCTIKKLSF